MLRGADLHLQVEIVADLSADGLHDVDDEPGPVFERAAVLVMAIVDRRAEELRNEVAIGAVQLDAVEPRLARPPGAFGKGVDGLRDLGNRHRLAFESVERVSAVGRAQTGGVFDARHVALAAAVTELQDVLAVVLVYGLADLPPERNPLVAIDRRVVRHDPAANQHGHE